ncbi:MAG: TetR/AcrR family transcriptional regulator [Candidatus Pristimantibacillus sp.]
MNDTKQKLLHITRQMIDKQGIEGISMRELGKEMNLSRSAMYRHFKNKEDLLAAIVAENFQMLTSNIHEITDNITDPRKLIYAILYAYFDFGINNQEHYHLMFRKQWDKELYPDLHSSAFGIFKHVENCLGQVGNIRKSPTQSTAIMYAFIHGLVDLNLAQHSETEKGLDSPTYLIESFLDLIFI